MNNNMNLSAPWITYYKQVAALFSGDPQVEVSFDENSYILKILVSDPSGRKGDAIRQLLPSNVAMGNINITINVESIPVDEMYKYAALVATAFNGNPHFAEISSTDFPSGMSYVFGLFNKEAVQYYNDDLTQYGGLTTVIPAELAAKIINTPTGFYFSTVVD